jgi:hypothetical protein
MTPKRSLFRATREYAELHSPPPTRLIRAHPSPQQRETRPSADAGGWYKMTKDNTSFIRISKTTSSYLTNL